MAAGVAIDCAHAEGKLEAHYTISMTGISIGKSAWTVDIGDNQYTISANGGASGVMSLLVSGEGLVTTQGIVKDGLLIPKSFTTSSVEDDQKTELRMMLDAGTVRELIIEAAPPNSDRVALTDAHLRGVVDPLTAMLVAVGGSGDVLTAEVCNRKLPVFDGRRRYDLALSFKRMDNVKAEIGYQGPVLVCGMMLQPIAGHRASSTIVKYVADRSDMEIWFAPIAGTRILAPFRVAIPTIVGTMAFQATRFDAATVSPRQ